MARSSELVIIPTGYSLDDMEPQVETANDLQSLGVNPEKIVFIFCRADGSDSEDAAARRYLHRAGMNVLNNVFSERPSIRQGHNNGLAASEISHKSVRDKITPLTVEISALINPKANESISTNQEPELAHG